MDQFTLDDGADMHSFSLSSSALVQPVIEEANATLSMIRAGRNLCFVISGLTVFLGIYQLWQGVDAFAAGGVVVEGLVFAALGFLVPRKPLLYLSIAGSLYLLNVVILAADNMGALGTGLAVRCAILYFFFRAIQAAAKLKKARLHLREYGMAPAHLAPLKELKELKELAINER